MSRLGAISLPSYIRGFTDFSSDRLYFHFPHIQCCSHNLITCSIISHTVFSSEVESQHPKFQYILHFELRAAQSLIHNPNVQNSSLLALATNISTLHFKINYWLLLFFPFFPIGTSRSVLQQIRLCLWHAIRNQYYQAVEFLSMKKVSFHTHISRTDSETKYLQDCFFYKLHRNITLLRNVIFIWRFNRLGTKVGSNYRKPL